MAKKEASGTSEDAAKAGLTTKVDGNAVTLDFDIDPVGYPSSTGKTRVLFTTSKFVRLIEPDVGVQVTVVRYVKKGNRS